MKIAVDLLASASRFAIAAAIIYFAYQLAQINDNVAVVTQSVDQVSQHIGPTLEEVREIRLEIAQVRKLIPDILAEVAEVRQQIPEILAEVAEVRQQIPLIVEQVESINKNIDPILQRIDKTVAVVDATQRQIPQIISTADDAIVAINDTREEVLPYLPATLEEIKLTRDSINPTLDRVEDLVDDTFIKATETIASAKDAGKKASEGAVTGFFTGLIKLPFKFIGSLASPIVDDLDAEVARQLTDKDIKLMAEAGVEAIKSKTTGKDWSWKNPKSGNSGSITIIRKHQLHGLQCVEARIFISNKSRQIMDEIDDFCLSKENKWINVEEIDK